MYLKRKQVDISSRCLQSNLANLLIFNLLFDSFPDILPEDRITVLDDKIEEYPVRVFFPVASSTFPPLH